MDISGVNFHNLGVNSHLNHRLKTGLLICSLPLMATKVNSLGADLLLKSSNSLKYVADGIISFWRYTAFTFFMGPYDRYFLIIVCYDPVIYV